MFSRPIHRLHSLGTMAFIAVSFGATIVASAEAPSYAPATVSEAAKVIDLSALPLVEGAEKPIQCRLAGLSYKAPGTVKNAFEFHRKQLLDRKWKELPGGYASDQSSNATFARDGFSLSLTVFSAGKSAGNAAEEANVTIVNHGNLKLDKLPLPAGAKSMFAGPVSAMYVTEKTVKETAEACKKLLLAQGWRPYGTAGDTQFFKLNAVRLSAYITAAPAQGGKTMITYSTEQMSADLPAPDDATNLQYADVTTQLFFDSGESQRQTADFYRKILKKTGWEATTDSPIQIDFKHELIFRNPGMDMLTLEMTDVEGKTRVLLKLQSAAEVAELERLAKAEIERRKAEENKPLPKLSLPIPAAATEIERDNNRVEFKLPAGKAKAVIEGWRKQFGKDGWKEEAAVMEDMAGTISFNKGDQHLSVIYSDTGFLPAEITLQVTGLEIEKSSENNQPRP